MANVELPGGLVADEMVLGSLRRPTDKLGRPQPRILGALGILSAGMACGGEAPITIPGSAWAVDVGEHGASVAVVACPCGVEPHVEIGCVGSCECERYYFFAVDKVLVFNSPVARKDAPTPELQSEA